jgi:hypothetical protein
VALLLRRWERLLAVLRRRNRQIGGYRCGGNEGGLQSGRWRGECAAVVVLEKKSKTQKEGGREIVLRGKMKRGRGWRERYLCLGSRVEKVEGWFAGFVSLVLVWEERVCEGWFAEMEGQVVVALAKKKIGRLWFGDERL